MAAPIPHAGGRDGGHGVAVAAGNDETRLA